MPIDRNNAAGIYLYSNIWNWNGKTEKEMVAASLSTYVG